MGRIEVITNVENVKRRDISVLSVLAKRETRKSDFMGKSKIKEFPKTIYHLMANALMTLKISHVFTMIIFVLIYILSGSILLEVNNALITDVLIFVLITILLY